MATRSGDRNFGCTTSFPAVRWIAVLCGVQDLYLTCDAQMNKTVFFASTTLRDSNGVTVHDGDTSFVLGGSYCKVL